MDDDWIPTYQPTKLQPPLSVFSIVDQPPKSEEDSVGRSPPLCSAGPEIETRTCGARIINIFQACDSRPFVFLCLCVHPFVFPSKVRRVWPTPSRLPISIFFIIERSICVNIPISETQQDNLLDTQQVAHLDFFFIIERSICVNIPISETQQGNLLGTQQVTHLDKYCSRLPISTVTAVIGNSTPYALWPNISMLSFMPEDTRKY